MKKSLALTGVVACVVLLGSDSPKGYDDKVEYADGLQGSWKAVSMESSESPVPLPLSVFEDTVVTFNKGHLVKLVGSNEYRWTYKADPSKRPAHLDQYHSDERGRVWKEIYRVEGDTLKIAYVSTGGWDGRPTSFSDKNNFIVTYKRVKR
jgi:uncharacterized protein (TIGR03067 family)